MTVANPRWERKEENEAEAEDKDKDKIEGKIEDEDEVENTEEKASFRDTIILMADVTGVPEGSGIIFDIYKTSEDPSMCFATANGKNVPFFPGCA